MQPCTPTDARTRLDQATTMLEVAKLVIDYPDDAALPGVAAAVAVLAGIAASDAVCCAAFGERPRGQDHKEAIKVLQGVHPGGKSMAADLRRLLAAKDTVHYGMKLTTARTTETLIRATSRLCEKAEKIVGFS
jgi:hypothetical protein